jgi:hypothetical protein
MLFSFERPGRALPVSGASRRTLKTAQIGQKIELFDHRQDIKGMWWMPWHQEPMKDVDGCDKPR